MLYTSAQTSAEQFNKLAINPSERKSLEKWFWLQYNLENLMMSISKSWQHVFWYQYSTDSYNSYKKIAIIKLIFL